MFTLALYNSHGPRVPWKTGCMFILVHFPMGWGRGVLEAGSGGTNETSGVRDIGKIPFRSVLVGDTFVQHEKTRNRLTRSVRRSFAIWRIRLRHEVASGCVALFVYSKAILSCLDGEGLNSRPPSK